MGSRTERIDSFDGLKIQIKTLGYPNKGESIMVSLKNHDKDLYNVFIDNYEVDEYQYWLATLPKNTRINAFIWTHPDEDHSLGVEKLLSAFDPDKKAQIYLPSSITKRLLQDNGKDASIPCYDFLKKTYNTGRNYQWNEVSVFKGEDIRYFYRQVYENKNNDSVTFRIGFMLPIGAVVNRRVDKNKMNAGEMNDLSLFTVIELNKVRYIFAGDLAERNIQFLEDEYLSNCRFVKIPHHGSDEPIKLIDKLTTLPYSKSHSVTTVFGSTHPYETVLDRYAKKCNEVYCTGRGDKSYGMVDICYNVKEVNVFDIELEGNAIKVRP